MSASRLADEAALSRLVDLYARAVDRGDGALLASLFTEDATLSFGAMFDGGRDAFVAMIAATTVDMVTHHLMANRLFAIDGDRGEGEVYSVNTHVMPVRDGICGDYIGAGRYLDRYRRLAGGWRFVHRTRVVDWTNGGAGDGVAGVIAGGKRGDDPSAGFPLLEAVGVGRH